MTTTTIKKAECLEDLRTNDDFLVQTGAQRLIYKSIDKKLKTTTNEKEYNCLDAVVKLMPKTKDGRKGKSNKVVMDAAEARYKEEAKTLVNGESLPAFKHVKEKLFHNENGEVCQEFEKDTETTLLPYLMEEKMREEFFLVYAEVENDDGFKHKNFIGKFNETKTRVGKKHTVLNGTFDLLLPDHFASSEGPAKREDATTSNAPSASTATQPASQLQQPA